MKYIIALLISMIPLVELRGAVPVAIASGIPWWQALILCVIGNMIPVPIIFFFARRVLEWGADKPLIGGFFTWCLKKGHSGGQKLEKAAGDKGVFWALLLFVGIPLPGTGAWTGTLAASILDWDFKRSVIAVMLGVILAGIIMGTLSLLLGVNTFAHLLLFQRLGMLRRFLIATKKEATIHSRNFFSFYLATRISC